MEKGYFLPEIIYESRNSRGLFRTTSSVFCQIWKFMPVPTAVLGTNRYLRLLQSSIGNLENLVEDKKMRCSKNYLRGQ